MEGGVPTRSGRPLVFVGGFPTRAGDGQAKHGKEDDDDAKSGERDGGAMLGNDGKAAVDEFDVDPIDEQRGGAQLNGWAETLLTETPAAPGVGKGKEQEQNATA